MNLVIVSGPEATGKSGIAQEVAQLLGYKYQSKDVIKEQMFDHGSHDTNDSSWYENKAKDEFFDQIQQFVVRNESAVIESNFIAVDRQRLVACLGNAQITEIFCTARGFMSFIRFVKRNETNNRHKGHHDRKWYWSVFKHDVARMLGIQWPYKPLGFTNKLLAVDTTNFSKINCQAIADFAGTTS